MPNLHPARRIWHLGSDARAPAHTVPHSWDAQLIEHRDTGESSIYDLHLRTTRRDVEAFVRPFLDREL